MCACVDQASQGDDDQEEGGESVAHADRDRKVLHPMCHYVHYRVAKNFCYKSAIGFIYATFKPNIETTY